jgi:hypothetical protein
LASKNSQNYEKFSFDNTKETFTLGRDSACDVSFIDDKGFSKIQTTFIFDKVKKSWKVKDGSMEKNSTNGTW